MPGLGKTHSPECHLVGHCQQILPADPTCFDEEVLSCAEPQTLVLASAVAMKDISLAALHQLLYYVL